MPAQKYSPMRSTLRPKNCSTNNKSPSRKSGELDNRGSHFYLCLYWAEALAKQTEDLELQKQFAPLAAELAKNEAAIIDEMNAGQGGAINIGGYYFPDSELASQAMRPNKTFNELLAKLA